MSFPPSAPPLPDVERALVIVAHPDDVDFGAAGTVARWVSEGIDVSYCLVTRGETGGFDDTPRDQVPGLREAEQRAAAAAVGRGTPTAGSP
jgi:LmbE family N-acetylglucosaminyl deacetylase